MHVDWRGRVLRWDFIERSWWYTSHLKRWLKVWQNTVHVYPKALHLTGLETYRWRPAGDSSLRWLRRRLRDVSWSLAWSRGVVGCSNMFDFFLATFWSLVSSRSRRRLRDVSISRSVAATSRRLILSVTSPRRLRDRCWRPRRLPETSPQLRRRLRDVAETCESWLSPCLETSPRRLIGESASHLLVSRRKSPELPRLISRGDVSASEIGPLHYFLKLFL